MPWQEPHPRPSYPPQLRPDAEWQPVFTPPLLPAASPDAADGEEPPTRQAAGEADQGAAAAGTDAASHLVQYRIDSGTYTGPGQQQNDTAQSLLHAPGWYY